MIHHSLTPKTCCFFPFLGKCSNLLKANTLAGFLTNLNLPVFQSLTETYHYKDVMFLTSKLHLYSLSGDYGKITLLKINKMKEMKSLLIFEKITKGEDPTFLKGLSEFKPQINISTSIYAFIRRLTLFVVSSRLTTQYTEVKQFEATIAPIGYEPGSQMVELKEPIYNSTLGIDQMHISEKNLLDMKLLKSIFTDQTLGFSWNFVRQYLELNELALDLRFDRVYKKVKCYSPNFVVFKITTQGSPEVVVHNFMRHLFNSEAFISLTDFSYPLNKGKEMSVSQKNDYLRTLFRKYNSLGTGCMIYIPGTVLFATGVGYSKETSLKNASIAFIELYSSISFTDLNKKSLLCPRCKQPHNIEECNF